MEMEKSNLSLYVGETEQNKQQNSHCLAPLARPSKTHSVRWHKRETGTHGIYTKIPQ